VRVNLVTEGNYPVVVGGVTRWCQLLIGELRHVEWTVQALGVAPIPGLDVGVPVTYPSATPSRAAAASTSEGIAAVVELTRQLLAARPEPSALQRAVVECHRLRRSLPDLVRQRPPAVDLAVVDALSGVEGRLRPERVEECVEVVQEVVDLAMLHPSDADLVVCACAGRAAVPAVVAQAVHGVPVIVVEHGIYVDEAVMRTSGDDVDPVVRSLVRRAASNLAAMAYFTAVTVVDVSRANRSRSITHGADARRTLVVPNGVGIPSEVPALPRTSVVGMVGRVDPFKGVDIFVEMAAEVLRRVPGAQFVHIGPVEAGMERYARDCVDRAAALGLGQRLEFRGAHPAPEHVLNEFDVFVMPSRTEGLPFALLEAMAAARPVVATQVGGMPEVLDGCGVLVPDGSVELLAAAVVDLLQHPDQAAQMGRQARARVAERYPLDVMLQGFVEAFDLATADVSATA
jgi:glycosyltransferase involved in cell wall biosynthesis